MPTTPDEEAINKGGMNTVALYEAAVTGDQAALANLARSLIVDTPDELLATIISLSIGGAMLVRRAARDSGQPLELVWGTLRESIVKFHTA